jgi:hypothetical protein
MALSGQSVPQQLTHPYIQDLFVQHDLMASASTHDDAVSSSGGNREPILLARNGSQNGSGHNAPRGLPSLFEYEKEKRVEPEFPTHLRVRGPYGRSHIGRGPATPDLHCPADPPPVMDMSREDFSH